MRWRQGQRLSQCGRDKNQDKRPCSEGQRNGYAHLAMTITKTFLATTGAGVARATGTRTGHWSVDLVLAGQDVRCLAANPRRSGVVYAGTQNQGVLLSEDNGCTWQSAGLAGHCVKSLAASETEPGTLYAGTRPPMVFVSRDDGATWIVKRCRDRG